MESYSFISYVRIRIFYTGIGKPDGSRLQLQPILEFVSFSFPYKYFLSVRNISAHKFPEDSHHNLWPDICILYQNICFQLNILVTMYVRICYYYNRDKNLMIILSIFADAPYTGARIETWNL